MKKTSISSKGLFIWLLCAIFFTYEFMLRTLLGTFEPPLLSDLHLSLVTFTVLSSTAYQTIYGFMQMPVGIILDKLGLKKVLTLAIIICALSVIAFSLTHQFKSAFVFRLLMGFGSSFGFIALLVAVYDWLPRDKTGLFIGLSQFIGTLGPMLAAGPMNAVAESGGLNWRLVFTGLGIVGLMLALLVFIYVENNHDFTGSFQILKRPAPISNMLKNLTHEPQVWLIGLYSACIYFTIEYLSENSGKSFLMLNGYSSQEASNFITLSWLGYALGCPLTGFVSDKLCRRKIILTISAMASIFAAFVIFYLPSKPILLLVGFFVLGFGASGQSVAFAMVAEQCGPSYLAAGLGFNNALIVVIASINAPMMAWLLNHFKEKHSALLISDYQYAFNIPLGLMISGLIISTLWIKETFCKSAKAPTLLSI